LPDHGIVAWRYLALVCLLPFIPLSCDAAEDAPTAQELASGIVPQIENGKRIYAVAQFARFSPQTAADVVAQIPGFTVTNISNDRGLGEASQNVLINGQRITGKGNDANAVLRRIPVNTILRMEIMDGAMLNISGLSGHVLNLVTEQKGIQGNYTWRPRIRERVPAHWYPGEVNVSGSSALGDYSLGFRWDGFRGGGWGEELETRPATGISFIRHYPGPRFANDIPKLSGTFNRRTDAGSIWNFNGSVERSHFKRRIATFYQVPGQPSTTESSRGDERRWRTEIGTDYEFALGEGRLKWIGFFTQRPASTSSEQTTLVDGASVPAGSRFSRDSTEGERVLRAEYRWKALGGDWTVSGEAAYNFVDATGSLDVLDAIGVPQPVPLPGASSRVEEKRGQSILSFSRPLRQGLSLQLTGGYEYSRLGQDAGATSTRSFWRPKGSASLAWNPANQWEMNLRLQRKVGQLNFFDFLASVDVINNNANGSNPELVPPQSWVLQLETIRNLGGNGKIRLNIETEDVADLVNQVPISATAEAPGNLAKARRFQVMLDSSLLLDAIGIPGGKIDNQLTWRDTRMRDPVLGNHRQWNGNRSYWNVDFRQDVPGSKWAWGLFTERQSANRFYRLDYEERFSGTRPFGSVFLEHKDVWGLKMRATVGNLWNTKDHTQSVSYLARRDGPVDYARDYYITWRRFLQLTFSGTF
jgi:outer membrane receptor for ferrienterochelin and colicins